MAFAWLTAQYSTADSLASCVVHLETVESVWTLRGEHDWDKTLSPRVE